MAKPFSDKRFQLGEPLSSKLIDFCEANYGANAVRVIREALEEHIDRRLENPEIRERFEAARKARLGLPDKVVKLIKKPGEPA